MFQKIINSFGNAISGLRTVLVEERNFKIELFIGVIVLIFAYYFDFSTVEWILCIVAIVLVLMSEIVNTAIEDLSTKVEPNHDPVIGRIKDMTAGLVLVSSIGALFIGLMVFWNHFL
mgnify:CR=1 FL=1